MNRAQRRASARSASQGAPSQDRQGLILDALDHLALAASADSTVVSASLILPDGEVLHLDAATARAMAGEAVPGTVGSA